MLKVKSTTAFYALLTLVLAGLLAATSCKSDDSGDGYPDDICVDFATFASTSDRGTVFTLRKAGDSPLVTLTAAVRVDTTKLKPDTRVLIQYVPSGGQAPYESGPIALYGIGQIVTGPVDIQTPETIGSWHSDNIKMTAMTRSGDYLDVWAQGNYDAKFNRFTLAADQTTLGDDFPRLYLVFEGDAGIGYPHQLYASFSLSDVWSLPTCSGVTVTYQTSGGSVTQTFNKSVNQ